MAARILAKRGDGGPSMPLQAFSIASLVLGAGCCAMGGILWASGIREVGIFNFVLLLSPPESSRISYVNCHLCSAVDNSSSQSYDSKSKLFSDSVPSDIGLVAHAGGGSEKHGSNYSKCLQETALHPCVTFSIMVSDLALED